jgi:16S rRNA (cytidine1402-2'-O)-methyltransferase
VKKGTLYLVGTPIGNLGDISPRAREALREADVVAAEDTRRAGRLLERLGIQAKRLTSLFEGNDAERSAQLLVELEAGKDVALISDAGMPAVSDPGFRLVRACADAGVEVRVVPGPSAVLSALVVSGLPTDRFVFEGFLPRRAGERRARLESLAEQPRTLVVFESPHRVQILLRDLLVAFGDRRIALCRELTKLYEEVIRGRVSEVLARIGDHDLKGEVVVVIEGAAPPRAPDLDALVEEARRLTETGVRKRDAASEVAKRHGVSANALYREMLRHQN